MTDDGTRSGGLDRRALLTLLPLMSLAIDWRAAEAAEHVVQMRNKGTTGVFVFEPALLRVAVGDVVRFVPEVPGHDCQSIAGMVPEGAPGWKGRLSQEVTAAITLPGVYGYKCVPHYGMGMVGLLVAGNPSINLAAARAFRHPGKAAKAFESLLAELG